MTPRFQFADLTTRQVAALRKAKRRPVLLLPVGSVEPHGPHAPLSTDTLISAGVCERAADWLDADPEVRALILPALPYGVTRYAAAFPGAVTVSEETLYALITDIGKSLAGQGFSRLVVVNNHLEPEHVAAIRRAVDTLGAGYLDILRRSNAERLTEEFRSASCHAGRYETSMVLVDRPDLVAADVAKQLPELHVDMAAEIQAGRTDFLAMGMDQAYCGAPAEATRDEGQSTFDTLTEMLVEVIRAVAGRR